MSDRNWQELLQDWLHEGIVEVTFKKVSGEDRWMRCTLSPLVLSMVLDDDEKDEDDSTKKKRTPNPNICVVWDIERDGWRSFRYDTIIKVVYNHEEITGQCVITNNLTLVPINS